MNRARRFFVPVLAFAFALVAAGCSANQEGPAPKSGVVSTDNIGAEITSPTPVEATMDDLEEAVVADPGSGSVAAVASSAPVDLPSTAAAEPPVALAAGRMAISGGVTKREEALSGYGGKARGVYRAKSIRSGTGGAFAHAPAKRPARDYKPVDEDRMTALERRRPAPAHRPGLLTAGEWSDLENWGFWLALFEDGQQHGSGWQSFESSWNFFTRNRVDIKVKGTTGVLADAKVELRDGNTVLWTGRTNNKGEVSLFAPRKSRNKLVVRATANSVQTDLRIRLDQQQGPVVISLDTHSDTPAALDVMFVVDTTGSMSDELTYLQAELGNVISRVQDKNGQELSIRISVNFYRDRSDAYLVRSFPFTTSLKESRASMKAQIAQGGGDFPEAVDMALEDAISGHDWRKNARARLMFLILDAPPHQNAAAKKRLNAMTISAAKQGIRIIPVVGSGIDKSTEFLMRFLAVSTGGTYLFLTDHSGIGGSHLKPTIGRHEIKHLNDLIVEIINRYVAS